MGAYARTSTGLLAAGLLLAAPAPASADPGGADESFPLVCDNGVTYRIVVNGNGEFTPAHDVDSNSILVPTEFGPFVGTVTDPDGNVVDTIDEPGSTKGRSSKPRATTTSCTFHFEMTDEAGSTFSADSSVTGFVTPLR
jgi:hypothetical protein